ncbi:MAG TPA: transcription elongation factor GreB [Gammaproteobacteria bacterium]|nr:transcription elongation factor GreB [Gammaproteobacteria bacterium]
MSRWRPPAPHASPYITAEGYRRLETELKELWQRRALVTSALAAAAAEGDRSENAEYIYRKKELREIDRRIRYLQKRLPDLHVVTESPAEHTRIFFGAWVTLEDSQGIEIEYRIVGPDELDPTCGHVSMDSPLAQALLKKAVDDEIIVKTPAGETYYYIVNVRYGPAGV